MSETQYLYYICTKVEHKSKLVQYEGSLYKSFNGKPKR